MSQLTTHDVTMLRYSQPYVAPEDVPRVLTPVPPVPALDDLSDLRACMGTDPQSDTDALSAPELTSEPAPVTLADVLARLASAHEEITIAENDLAAIAANLAGRPVERTHDEDE